MTGKSDIPPLELAISTSFCELESLEADWNVLHSSCPNSAITNSFSYVYITYQHFLESTDSLHFLTIRDSKLNQLVGLFPFVVTNKQQFDFNFQCLSFLGLNKFKKPEPLINDNYREQCWNLVFAYTLRAKVVWQLMDLGINESNTLKSRNFLERLLDMTFVKKTSSISYHSSIQLGARYENENQGPYIKKEKRFELLKKYSSKSSQDDYDFQVYGGEELGFCFSQITSIAERNLRLNQDDTHVDFTFDFYQKYFCRLAFKHNLSFGILTHKAKVVSIEIGYLDNGNLYLDSNVIDSRWRKKHADVLSLNLFLKYHFEKGLSRCEFLCEDDSRLPYLNVNTNRIENKTLTKVCAKYALALSIYYCNRASQNMNGRIKQIFGIKTKLKA